LVGIGDGRLALPADAEQLTHFIPGPPTYALLAGIDAVILLRRNVRSLLPAADADRAVPGHRSGKSLGELADLPDHAIVDRGRLIGLWQTTFRPSRSPGGSLTGRPPRPRN
jgi:hypothetical protein